jgi:hypothetical protein
VSGTDDGEYMTLTDVEEILVFLFELLAERRIIYFRLKYAGGAAFTEVSVQLDRARRQFLVARQRENNRLRALATHLSGSESISRVMAAIPSIRQRAEAYRAVRRAIEESARELGKRFSGWRKVRVSGLRSSSGWVRETRQLAAELETALDLYDALREVSAQAARRLAEYRKAVSRYEEVRAGLAGRFPVRILRPRQRGVGVRIIESEVSVDRKSLGDLVAAVARVFRDFGLWRGDSSESSIAVLDTEKAKFLGARLVSEMDRVLRVANPRVQRAVEGSRAAYVASLEPGLSASLKAGWGAALVSDVQNDTREAVHRVARVLVDYHGVRMDNESIDYLSRAFGADEHFLATLTPDPSRQAFSEEVERYEPLTVLPLPDDIRRRLVEARGLR